jgi:hypothetical protein
MFKVGWSFLATVVVPDAGGALMSSTFRNLDIPYTLPSYYGTFPTYNPYPM